MWSKHLYMDECVFFHLYMDKYGFSHLYMDKYVFFHLYMVKCDLSIYACLNHIYTFFHMFYWTLKFADCPI